LWILRERGEPAGYFELRTHDDGAVRSRFRLLRTLGPRSGKFMLTRAVEIAWDRGASRVWLRTRRSTIHPRSRTTSRQVLDLETGNQESDLVIW
jgi:hypothetical protein